eukprot:16426882-Heterocapsa_arctica.AAC.1
MGASAVLTFTRHRVVHVDIALLEASLASHRLVGVLLHLSGSTAMLHVQLVLHLALRVDLLLQPTHRLVLDLVHLVLVAVLFFCWYTFLFSASTSSRSRSGYLHQ